MNANWKFEYHDVTHISCRLRGGPRKEFWVYRDGHGTWRDSDTGMEWEPQFYTDFRNLETGEKIGLAELEQMPARFRGLAEKWNRDVAVKMFNL